MQQYIAHSFVLEQHPIPKHLTHIVYFACLCNYHTKAHHLQQGYYLITLEMKPDLTGESEARLV